MGYLGKKGRQNDPATKYKKGQPFFKNTERKGNPTQLV